MITFLLTFLLCLWLCLCVECEQKEYIVSDAVKRRGLTSLEVHLKTARGLSIGGSRVSTCFCLISLTNQDFKMERSKSSVKGVHSDGEYRWDEKFNLSPLLTLRAVLNIKIFVPNLVSKNTFVAEFLIPIDLGSKLMEEEANDASAATATTTATAATTDGSKRSKVESPVGIGGNSGSTSPHESSKSKGNASSSSSSSSKHSIEIDSYKSSSADLSLLIGWNKEVVRWHAPSQSEADSDCKPELLLGLRLH